MRPDHDGAGPMRVGIVGQPDRAGALVRALSAEAPEARVVAVADAQDVGASGQDPGPSRHDDAADLLAAHPLDLLVVGGPVRRRLEYLTLALASDVPRILVEGPLAASEAEAMELARLAVEREGLARVGVGLRLRHVAPVLRDGMAARRVGPIRSMSVTEVAGAGDGAVADEDRVLGRLLAALDMCQSLAGARPFRLACFGGAGGAGWPEIPDKSGDDRTAIVEYQTGASLALHIGGGAGDPSGRIVLTGAGGAITADLLTGASDPDDADRMPSPSPADPDRAAVAALVGALRGAAADGSGDLVDALEATLAALALERARVEGRVVDLSDLWEEFDDSLEGVW